MAWPSPPTNGLTTTINGVEYVYDGANSVWNRVGSVNNGTGIDSITIADLVVTHSTHLGSAANVYIGGGSPGKYLTGDGSGGLTWEPPQAGSYLSNGTSNVTTISSGNITVSVAGTVNSAVFTSTGVNVAGYANITGNITAGNISIGKLTSSVATGTAPLTVTSTTRVANLNADRANITDYSIVTRQTAGVYYPTLTGANATGNYALAVSPNISFDISNSLLTTKNITINNNANVDNLVASSNITTSNLTVSTAVDLTGADILLGANAKVKLTGGSTGQYLQTDGTGNLSWANVSLSIVSNGTSNVNVASSGNVVVGVSGNSGILTVTGTGVNVAGYANISGNITSSGNLTITGNVNASALTSTIATGTSPLTVTSTTRVANLNATRANVSDYTSVTNTNSGCVYVAFANSSSSGNYALQSNTALYANISSGNFYAANFIGNVTGTVTGSATTAGTVTTAAQPNITSVGTLTGLTTTGVANFIGTSNVSLGAIGNLKITGGSSDQYLQTDGTGNVSWSYITSSGISNGTSNISILTAGGNINQYAAGNLTLVVTGTGANVTGYLNVNGNVAAGNVTTTSNVNASVLISSTSSGAPIVVTSTTRVGNLNVARANISDYTSVTTTASSNMYFTFANANNTSNYALYSNTAIYANIGSGSMYAANFVGNGSQLSGIVGANVTGTVGSATIAGTVTASAQSNITSLGTLLSVTHATNANITMSGASSQITGSNLVSASYLTGILTVASNAQPNITSTGTLTSLNVTGTAIFALTQDVTVSGTPSGTVNYDLYNGAVFDVIPTGNWTANIGNVATTNNRTTVVTFIITQSSVAYLPTVFQIAGVTQTVKWIGALAPTGTPNKIDLLAYSLIRSGAGAWIVLGSASSYG
jgi:hypothetical protein